MGDGRGGAWIISNDKISNEIFLYPDLTLALVGQIKLPECGSGTDFDVCELVGLNSDGGILVPLLKQTGSCLPVSSCEYMPLYQCKLKISFPF